MGIEEFVLDRAKRMGEKIGIEIGMKKGIESRNFSFVKTLLEETDFDNAKISRLAAVNIEFVLQVRNQLKP